MEKTALVFSGYNQRAVISLCRFFNQAEQSFAIVSAGPDDPINLTDYRSRVIFDRSSKVLTVDLFDKAASLIGPCVYCPTSEFLNNFVLENEDALAALGIDRGVPNRNVYSLLTGKKSSQHVFKAVSGVKIPGEMPLSRASVPCVLKPLINVKAGTVLYPVICETEEDLTSALSNVSPDDYFVQDYVFGQSYYFCAYLSKTGGIRSYWQENLLQQSHGKSIVLARSCPNPGVDEDELYAALASTGYYGPIMVEFIQSGGALNYIETNPRFWGPLQLGLDCCDLLSLYVADWFGGSPTPKSSETYRSDVYYAWAFGARQGNLKTYPAAEDMVQLGTKIKKFDVFSRPDTANLHDKV